MRRLGILTFTLGIALAFGASCSRLNQPNDSAITTDIKSQMFSDPSLKSASVDVTTKDGVVTLTGQVPDDSAHLAAYKIATGTKGVKKVDDQITIGTAQAAAPPPASEPAPAPAPEPSRPSRKHRIPRTRAAEQEHPAAVASAASPAPSEQPAPEAAQAPPPPPPPPPPQPITVTVPASSIVTVRTIDNIDSKTNRAGEVFRASLDSPIVVDDQVVIPKGADAYLKLENASSAGRISGRSELTLSLASIVFQGRTYNILTSDVKQSGASRGKRSAETIGGGAALGALIGAIAGGGKGAAIGAAVGGGAGTGVQVFTHGQQVKIPSETRLDFTLEQPFDVTYLPGKHSRRATSGDRPPRSE